MHRGGKKFAFCNPKNLYTEKSFKGRTNIIIGKTSGIWEKNNLKGNLTCYRPWLKQTQ